METLIFWQKASLILNPQTQLIQLCSTWHIRKIWIYTITIYHDLSTRLSNARSLRQVIHHRTSAPSRRWNERIVCHYFRLTVTRNIRHIHGVRSDCGWVCRTDPHRTRDLRTARVYKQLNGTTSPNIVCRIFSIRCAGTTVVASARKQRIRGRISAYRRRRDQPGTHQHRIQPRSGRRPTAQFNNCAHPGVDTLTDQGHRRL